MTNILSLIITSYILFSKVWSCEHTALSSIISPFLISRYNFILFCIFVLNVQKKAEINNILHTINLKSSQINKQTAYTNFLQILSLLLWHGTVKNN